MIKTKLLNLILLLGALNSFSQVPQSFKYQAMTRDTYGEVMVNQSVSLLIEIIRETSTVYSESHKLITNQFGLINLEIGHGNPVTGIFSDIDWSLGDYYIAVSIDPDGGTNYSSVGTAQLLSVPYALYANKSGDSYWDTIQSNLNYNKGKVMIGTPDFLTVTGDLNWIPALSIEGGLWTKMPKGITSADIDNMYLNNDTIGTGLPFVGLYSIYDGDYHFRGYWGVNIDRNGGYAGSHSPVYKGLNSDAGSFAVRYRISPTAFRTDFIVNGKGNVGIGTTTPERKLSLEDSIASYAEDDDKRIFLELKNKSIDFGSEVEMNLKAGSNGTITKLIKYSDTYNIYPGEQVSNYGMLSDDGAGIILSAWANNGNIIFKTAHEETTGYGIERMRIDSLGRVGMGITDPQRTLHISDVIRLEPTITAPSSPAEGDIYMDASTHKLMVFDGTIWQACW
jgi:hypothetical protein